MELPSANGKRPKYILYLRVSTDSQNTDLQKKDLTEYANRRGWDYEILEDKATGKNSNRPALKQLMQMIRQKRIDGLAIWRADRLFRSLKEAVLMLSEMSELGVAFYSHMDSLDMTTSTGRLFSHLLFALAEFESELIKSRVTSGLQAARARGVRLGRPQVVTPELIQQVIKLREKGTSIRMISEALGRKLSKTSIERILRDHFNNRSNKSSI